VDLKQGVSKLQFVQIATLGLQFKTLSKELHGIKSLLRS